MAKVEAYCITCKKMQEMKDPELTTMKNGMEAYKGTCSKCGQKLYRIVGKKK